MRGATTLPDEHGVLVALTDESLAFLTPSQAGIGDHPHLSTLVKARRPQHPALSRALRAPEPIPPHNPWPQSLARAVRSWSRAESRTPPTPARALPLLVPHLSAASRGP